jgi:hypothetical protein
VKGTCTGTGRLQVRLNEGEDPETIRQRFVNKDILVKNFKNAPAKKSDFSKPNW